MATDHATIEELSALLDGELTTDEQAKVEAHLAGCMVCRRQLEDLRQTVMRVSQLATIAPPRSFTVPLEARTVVAPSRSRARPELLRAFSGVAAVIMVLFFAADAARFPAVVTTALESSASVATAPQPQAESFAPPSTAPGAASGAAAPISPPAADASNAAGAPSLAQRAAEPAAPSIAQRAEETAAPSLAQRAAEPAAPPVPQAAAPVSKATEAPDLRSTFLSTVRAANAPPAQGPSPLLLASVAAGLVAVALFALSFFVGRRPKPA